MQHFIILTGEGSTLAPNPEPSNVMVENLQVLGFTKANNKIEAVQNFKAENSWVKDAGYTRVIALAIGDDPDGPGFKTFVL